MKPNGEHFSINKVFKIYREASLDCVSSSIRFSFDRKKDYRLAKRSFKANMKITKRNRRLGLK